MNFDLVITHGGCRDGFTAAWIAHRKFPDAEYLEGIYGQGPPDVRGRDVLIADFSYKRPIMERLLVEAKSLTVLDHHRTAEADLKDLPGAVFDMERSGAGITWDYLNPQLPRPWLVDYVEDHDLWRHKLQASKAVNAFLSTLDFSFPRWAEVNREMGPRQAAAAGEHVLAKTAQYVKEMIKDAIEVEMEGQAVYCVNASKVDISELLNELIGDRPFAMGWRQRGDLMFEYSLRSNGSVDVSEIARKYGGGGHARAAGFELLAPLPLIQVSH